MPVWSDAEVDRAVELCLHQGKSAEQASHVLNEEFRKGRTRNSVIGVLTRRGVRLSYLDPSRHSRMATETVRRYAHIKRMGLEAKGGPPLDLYVRRLLRDDEKVIPPKGSKGLLIRKDGKLFANDDLNEQSCRWIHGDPLKHPEPYCSKNAIPGTSWCQEHYAKVVSGGVTVQRRTVEEELIEALEVQS